MNVKIDSIIVHDGDNVKGFFYDYRFLSNFHPCTVQWAGMTFPSVENAYQAAKCQNDSDTERFLSLTPNQAKHLGRKVELRKDWDDIKLELMYLFNHQKFVSNPELKALLLETGERYLEETNYWYDTFWGVCKGTGENHLGKILMRIREELK
jgi:ribA/ribD-fused uncharacterized protein